MAYNEHDFLQLAGIQHFCFCRRQWALIHIENLWADNYLTTDGNIVHERVHDNDIKETRGDTIITRGINVFSRTLGISGQCDVIEFNKHENGISLNGHEDLWVPFPIEYKRGSPKISRADELQLCTQAICIEEMFCCDITQGALYYNEIRRRVAVDFTSELRKEVKDLVAEMHELYSKRYTPKCKYTNACKACSMSVHCVPKLSKVRSVAEYIKEAMEESL